MKRLLILILFAFPSIAQAQTHPCDVTPPIPDVRPGAVFGVGFCVPSHDIEGNPINFDSFKVAVDSVQQFNAALTAIGGPNAAGDLYFETPKTLKVASAGNHTVVIIAANLGGDSIPSLPLSFAAKVLPPSQPTKPRIVK